MTRPVRLALAFGIALVPSLSRAQSQPTAPPPSAPNPPAEVPQQAPATPPPQAAPTLSPAEQKELEKALGADAAAAKQQSPAAAPQQSAPSSGGFAATAMRAFQSLNPDLSAIVDFAAGGYFGPVVYAGAGVPSTTKWTADAPITNGDDPQRTGINLEEVEVAMSATVDPYFRADVFLTIPDAHGLEVEEAYLTTTSLPGSLQLRAGVMRAAFGRQNTQHLHVQQFTRRPTANALFLGTDGLRAPALELSWLAPLPFYLLVTGEVLSVAAPGDPTSPTATFGGGAVTDLTYLANVRTFASLTDNTSALLGLSFATGRSAHTIATAGGGTLHAVDDDRASLLYGADLYVKWKPANVAETYMSLAWQTELFLRDLLDVPGEGAHAVDGALYSQLVWQVDRRWFLGLRGEIDGLVESKAVPREFAGAASATWQLSEFALARLYAEARVPEAHSDEPRFAAFLQLEASIGAHGAHPY